MKEKRISRVFKSVLCLLLTVAIPEISFAYTPMKVQAANVAYKKSKENLLEKNTLQYCLDIEKEKSTGLIDEKREEQLNQMGVFDEDIKNFESVDLECIEAADCIKVYTQYVEYAPIEENSLGVVEQKKDNCSEKSTDLFDNEIEGYESRVLSDKEVNELLKDIYLEEEKEEKSVTDKILTSIGLIPIEVYAASDSNETSYVRKTLIVVQSGEKVRVTFTAKWLISPKNRMLDVMTVTWGGASRDLDNPGKYAKLTYDIKNVSLSGKTTIKSDYQDCVKDMTYSEGGAGVEFELPDDVIYTIHKEGIEYGTYYKNITMTMAFWLKKNGTSIDVSADYRHQKKKVTVNGLSVVALTADIVVLAFAPPLKAATTVGKVVIGTAYVGAGASAISLFETEEWYETVGGEECSVVFKYK